MTHTGCPGKGLPTVQAPRGCYSTVGDLLRFTHALFGNRLVSASLTAELTTGKVISPGGRYGYGFAIRTRGPGDPPSIWHGTASATATGILVVNPRLGTTIAILTDQPPRVAQPTIDFVRGTMGVP